MLLQNVQNSQKIFLSTRDTKMNGRVIKKKLNPHLASWYVG